MRPVIILVAALAGCYDPQPQPGAPCGNGACPSPLTCSPATNTCELTAIDAGADLDAQDGSVDGQLPDAFTGAMLVQQVTNEAATGVSLSVTLSAPVSGHVLVVIGAAPSGPLDSVTGGGATWTKAAASYVNSNTEIWVGVTDGSSSIVTVNRAANAGEIWLAASEWSGLATTNLVDAASSAAGTTSPVAAGTITTTHAHDLVVFAASAFAMDPFGTPTPGAWTAMSAIHTTNVTQLSWYRVETIAGAIAPQVSRTAGDWDAAIAALRIAP